VGLSRTAIFELFRWLFFGYFSDEASVIVQRYAVRCRLFSDPKMHDLEWLFRAGFADSGRATFEK